MKAFSVTSAEETKFWLGACDDQFLYLIFRRCVNLLICLVTSSPSVSQSATFVLSCLFFCCGYSKMAACGMCLLV